MCVCQEKVKMGNILWFPNKTMHFIACKINSLWWINFSSFIFYAAAGWACVRFHCGTHQRKELEFTSLNIQERKIKLFRHSVMPLIRSHMWRSRFLKSFLYQSSSTADNAFPWALSIYIDALGDLRGEGWGKGGTDMSFVFTCCH